MPFILSDALCSKSALFSPLLILDLSYLNLCLASCSHDVDYIMFQMHNHDYCDQDKFMGTYIATVPDFVTGWLQEKQQQAADNGNDDYAAPDAAQYAQCTPFQIQGTYYYMQLGCADGATGQIAVNIYEDNACTVRSAVDGSDDANFDVSDLQVRKQSNKALFC